MPEGRGIFLGTVGSIKRKRLLADLSRVEYAPPGYLLFRRHPALMALRFDAAGGKIAGEPFILAETVRTDPTITGTAAFSASSSSALIYRSGASETTRFSWVDHSGNEIETIPGSEDFSEPALSPDGRHVAWHRPDSQSGSEDVWLFEFGRNIASRLTFDPSDDVTPIWSPDGSRIVFASSRQGNSDLYEKPADGSTQERLLLHTGFDKYVDDYSPDGKYLLYEELDPKTLIDL